jgi:phosphoribosylformylglycinamidine cyclo-ligase
MPGVYPVGRYDLAGFAVGALERGRFVDGSAVASGDIAIALPSSGVHSNGFSLVRRIIENAKLDFNTPAPFESGKSLGSALLAPTRIYAKATVALAHASLAHGMAHITGGGLIENPPRAFGKGLALDIDMAAITMPPVFDWLAKTGVVSQVDMARTFNCGIGMLIYVAPDNVDDALSVLRENGADDAVVAGRVHEKNDGPAVSINGLDQWRA